MFPHKLLGIVALCLLLAANANAVPIPTGGLCINKVTGAMRLVLDKNGLVLPCHRLEDSSTITALTEGTDNNVCVNQRTGAMRQENAKPCRRNEITTQLAQLLASPSPSASITPTPSPTSSTSPSDTPTPTPTPTSTPSGTPSPTPTAQPTIGSIVPQQMVDANGKRIGYVLDDLSQAPFAAGPPNSGAQGSQGVVININGQEFAVGATANGFPVTSNNDLMAIYYDGPNCTGTPYLPGPETDLPLIPNPLVIATLQGSGDIALTMQTGYIFDSIIYYPQTPYSFVAVQSELFQASIEGGVATGDCFSGPDTETIYGGVMSGANFPNFTPPFSTEPIPQN